MNQIPLDFGAHQLAAALFKMPTREAHVLNRRILRQQTAADCAKHWGVSESSFRQMEQAAVAAFAETLLGRPIGENDIGEDTDAERAVVRSIEQQLRDRRESVQQHLNDMQAAHVDSPAGRRETLFRRGAIVLLVAASLFFWQRSRQRDAAPDRNALPNNQGTQFENPGPSKSFAPSTDDP